MGIDDGRENRYLGPGQELFDKQASFAETLVHENLFEEIFGG